MKETMIQLTIGDREVEVTGWQASLVAIVLIGMPWTLGIVTIVRAAMYGW
jgi:hypothetical protein